MRAIIFTQGDVISEFSKCHIGDEECLKGTIKLK